MSADPQSPPLAAKDRKPLFTERWLDPNDSISEFLFGIVMTLSFTVGAGLVVQEGREATREILVAILGCNIAWGLIDGAMYVMDRALERSRKARLLQSLELADGEEQALAILGRELDERLSPITSAGERGRLYREMSKRLRALPRESARIKKEDLQGALAVFWLVFASTIPALLPFLLIEDRFLALRVSNLLLLLLLFYGGYRWARATDHNPWRFGAFLMLIGLVLVAVAMVFGG